MFDLYCVCVWGGGGGGATGEGGESGVRIYRMHRRSCTLSYDDFKTLAILLLWSTMYQTVQHADRYPANGSFLSTLPLPCVFCRNTGSILEEGGSLRWGWVGGGGLVDRKRGSVILILYATDDVVWRLEQFLAV